MLHTRADRPLNRLPPCSAFCSQVFRPRFWDSPMGAVPRCPQPNPGGWIAALHQRHHRRDSHDSLDHDEERLPLDREGLQGRGL